MSIVLATANDWLTRHLATQMEFVFYSYLKCFFAARGPANQAVIAGSYALYYCMLAKGQEAGFVPNDVDIFLTVKEYATLFQVLCSFFSQHIMLEMVDTGVTTTYRSQNSNPKEMPLAGILEFRIRDKRNGQKSHKIQMIIYNNEAFCFQSTAAFTEFVLGNFDISVCKVSMPFETKPHEFYFTQTKHMDDICNKEFSMIVKEDEIASRMFDRMSKYSERGFRIREITCANASIDKHSFERKNSQK